VKCADAPVSAQTLTNNHSRTRRHLKMAHVLMKSGDRLSEVVMSSSQLFEFLLKNGQYKIPQGQDIEQHRRLYKLLDEFKPTWDILEELEYQAETEKDEDIRTELIAEIGQLKDYLAPHEKEIEELLQQTKAEESQDTEQSSS
jgi:hypothetical protein